MKSVSYQLGNILLAALNGFPYFQGKGLLALAIVRAFRAGRPLLLPMPDGCRMQVTGDKTGEALISYWIGKYERETVPVFRRCVQNLAASEAVLDIGANVGFYVLQAAALRRRAAGRVYAFEPNPQARALLQENIQLSGLANVTTLAQGVAEHSGTLPIHIDRENSTASSLRQFDSRNLNEILEITVASVDDFLAEQASVRAGLILVDIEGGELPALAGARRTLERDQPYVIYEEAQATYAPFGYAPSDVRAYLRSLGYQLFALAGARPSPLPPESDGLAGAWQNVLALPPGRPRPWN